MTIELSPEIRAAAPGLKVIALEADIDNSPTPSALWAELEQLAAEIGRAYELPQINRRPAIAATRAAYKALGKDPNRYRPSAEALCRRMVKGMPLYRTLAAIDLINLLSVKSGHSIGGFDLDRIEGPGLTLGVGRAGEPFEAIGRGELNIEGLPIYRDAAGGIGTPTSDHERTKLSPATRRLLMIVNIYGPSPDLDAEAFVSEARRLLEAYCSATRVDRIDIS